MSVRKRSWITSKGEPRCAWVADCSDHSGRRRLRTFDTRAANGASSVAGLLSTAPVRGSTPSTGGLSAGAGQ